MEKKQGRMFQLAEVPSRLVCTGEILERDTPLCHPARRITEVSGESGCLSGGEMSNRHLKGPAAEPGKGKWEMSY